MEGRIAMARKEKTKTVVTGEVYRTTGDPQLNQAYSEAPNIFIDGIQGLTVTDGSIVRLNWVQDRMASAQKGQPVPEHPVERFVVLRMSMTSAQFLRIKDWMVSTVEKMKEEGILPPSPGK
jgi:hypothetical protein